ncbi:unnamed protein product [Rhizoctonia solani]|uniref:Uncharacterized protein n=1 Tax=Rhizoctonia solani TaxID=456999 RepID=A0A8H3AHU4_9AGAM|nr:unnamed protein product [Rhizoctonia solani]
MSSSTQVAVSPANIPNVRRRPIWRAGSLIAQSAFGLVNIPGLKEAALFAQEGAKAPKPDVIQAPKWNDEQARKHIDVLKGILARVNASSTTRSRLHFSVPLSIEQGGPDEVESSRQDVEAHKAEPEKTLSEKDSSKLARQSDIARFLAQRNQRIAERIPGFCAPDRPRPHTLAF